MQRYPFLAIERKWQNYWEENRTFHAREDQKVPPEKRRYVLDMFPYPSGEGLHVGHPEGYTASDIYSRFSRMRGYNVLHPMGFDSFGLPAENYAIATGTHPRATTEKNIKKFRKQIRSFGFSYDWSRELSTHTPDYYRWTQWIFLKLYEKGLVYQSSAPINWCSSCLTGLANEEVREGICDRCGTPIERKNLRQHMLRITAYADRLLADLDELDWSESIKLMQRNWIGRSEGATMTFSVEGRQETISTYTTRPDTLFGVTFMVLAPEHPLVRPLTSPDVQEEVERYLKRSAGKLDLDRTDLAKERKGVFLGSYAINPINGRQLPIWVADYVLMSYGTGAVMAVPGHDQRDWDFAKTNNLPILEVIKGGDLRKEAFVGDGVHTNSSFLDGLGNREAIAAMIRWLQKEKKGEVSVNYHLRDWIFSRQRYWGEPIPLVHCSSCGEVPLSVDQLPLLLPEVASYKPTGKGSSPLALIEEWVRCLCPRCGGEARRETNTMPQWAGSCWYYLRFLDPHNEREPFSRGKETYWMPVDLYVGGAEHAVLHLLYARFWHKVLYDCGLVGGREPFKKLVNQGLILSFAYKRKRGGGFLAPDQVEEKSPGIFVEKGSGAFVDQVAAKMSKSLRNVVNPDEIIEAYGADSVRVYEMFMGPLEVSKPWSTQGLKGIFRFLSRVWEISQRSFQEGSPPKSLVQLLHQTIKKVTEDTDSMNFNTAIAQMMIFVNQTYKTPGCFKDLWEPFTLILSPYAPHLCEEMWAHLGHKKSLAYHPFPSWDETLATKERLTVVVQVNGKVRARLEVSPGSSKETLTQQARALPLVQRWLGDHEPERVVVVPDRLVNFIVK